MTLMHFLCVYRPCLSPSWNELLFFNVFKCSHILFILVTWTLRITEQKPIISHLIRLISAVVPMNCNISCLGALLFINIFFHFYFHSFPQKYSAKQCVCYCLFYFTDHFKSDFVCGDFVSPATKAC